MTETGYPLGYEQVKADFERSQTDEVPPGAVRLTVEVAKKRVGALLRFNKMLHQLEDGKAKINLTIDLNTGEATLDDRELLSDEQVRLLVRKSLLVDGLYEELLPYLEGDKHSELDKAEQVDIFLEGYRQIEENLGLPVTVPRKEAK